MPPLTMIRTIGNFVCESLCVLALALSLASCSGGSGSSDGGDLGGGSGGPPSSGLPKQCRDQPADAVSSLSINPASTATGINASTGADRHYVSAPGSAALRKDLLVLFLGGAFSVTDSYTRLTEFAAAVDGFGAINLSYKNNTVVASCGSAVDCNGNFRGETVFGENTAYAPGARTWSTSVISVPRQDSVINRFVNLIDYLAYPPTSVTFPANFPPPSYWSQFVSTDARSPYITAHFGAVYPVWSKIILSGHSLGSGHAAFIATHLPIGAPVRRVAMFSGPDDTTDAAWLGDASATLPMSRFWGLRNANEGALGANISADWASLGGPSNGGVGGTFQTPDQPVGRGDGNPQGRQRLVTSEPNGASTLNNHNSTALDGDCLPEVGVAWDYLLTGNSTD